MARFILFSISTLLTVCCVAQTSLSGHVQTYYFGEDAPFANITVDDSITTTSDFDGQFKIANLTKGKHSIRIEWPAFRTLSDTFEMAGAFEFYDFFLIPQDSIPDPAYVPAKKDKDRYRATGGTVTREGIAKMPKRSVAEVAGTVSASDITPIKGCNRPIQAYSTARRGRKSYRRTRKAMEAKYDRKLTKVEKRRLKKEFLK